MISTAAEEDDVSWGNAFVTNFTSALHWAEPDGDPVNADTDGNGHISMMEAFNYAAENDSLDDARQCDDNGDGVSHTDSIPNGGDGPFGADTCLEDISTAVPSLSLFGVIPALGLVSARVRTDGVSSRRVDPPAG